MDGNRRGGPATLRAAGPPFRDSTTGRSACRDTGISVVSHLIFEKAAAPTTVGRRGGSATFVR